MMKKLIMSIFFLTFVLLSVAYPASLTIRENGDIFAETDRYQVGFKNGSFTHLHNKLTQETYTHQGVETFPEEDNHFAFNRYRIAHADFLEVEKVAPLTAKLTARWNERSHQKILIMWVSIDERTGDLIIKQEGADPRHGAASIAWRLANLDHNQVSVILPAIGGLFLNADGPESMEHSYPGRGWQARLALLQGNTGGCSIMSLDKKNQFNRFNYIRYSDAFQVEFITDNFLASKRSIEAGYVVSTTWRLNTYRGDWQVPAEKYRQGMIKRDVSRVARPPAWVKDIQLVIMYCSLHRPQHIPRMLDFLAQQIDPQNVLIFCRSGSGSEAFGSFASEAKARGFRIMLYTGFLFTDQDHPRWEPYFYRGDDGNIIGYSGKDGFTAYINPAAAAYRKHKVQVLKNLQSKYNIDAFHLDVNYFIPNQKPIDGLTPIQGNMLLHEELIAAMPGVLFAGEGIHEVTAPYVALYSRGDDDPGFVHPITDFLFSQWSLSYGSPLAYLGDRLGGLEHRILTDHIQYYKQVNVIPTIRYHYEGHFPIQQAIAIVHRTTSNAEFWEDLEKMVNSPYREDINFDGVVNILDLVIVANAFGDDPIDFGPDLNFDGVVNILDLVMVANAFGNQ